MAERKRCGRENRRHRRKSRHRRLGRRTAGTGRKEPMVRLNHPQQGNSPTIWLLRVVGVNKHKAKRHCPRHGDIGNFDEVASILQTK